MTPLRAEKPGIPWFGPRSPRKFWYSVCGGVCLVIVLLTSCRPSDSSEARSVAAYGQLTATPPPSPLIPVRPPLDAAPPSDASLSLIQTELCPATLWHCRSESLSLFANMPVTGLAGPSFLAYSSPTGITVLRPGERVDGAQMRENWLLLWFAGATGWEHWDSPWAAFFQRRPTQLRFSTNGVQGEFGGPAGYVALLPLYGYKKLPQKGAELAAGRTAKGNNLQTWEWGIVVARDPLVRLRYWSAVTRRFPVYCEDMFAVARNRDTVTIRQRFTWIEVPDDWGTKPLRLAPVSPTIGLTLLKGENFPVTFSKRPLNFELATPYGPFFGVPDADDYEMSFPVLRYVHEMEEPALPIPPDAPPVVQAALQRLRTTAHDLFDGPLQPERPPADGNELCRALLSDPWYARALPYYDATTRSNAVALLRRCFQECLSAPGRLTGPLRSGAERSELDDLAPRRGLDNTHDSTSGPALLQCLWAYAHFAGDTALIKESWPGIRRLFTAPSRMSWAGFACTGPDELCEAPAALAFARLAYLAGDLDAYQYGTYIFARELIHHYVKQRGATWFREQQPWHSMQPIPQQAYLTHLRGDEAGWQIEPAELLGSAGARMSHPRWIHFQDLDLARFYRDCLPGDVRKDVNLLKDSWSPTRARNDDNRIGPLLVLLHSLLVNASPTDLATILAPQRIEGSPSDVLASCVAFVRSAQPPRFGRLIPAAEPSPFALGVAREAEGPHAHLVQEVVFGSPNQPDWPRLVWRNWTTPPGQPWNFGQVRAGTNATPARARVTPLNWNSVRVDFFSE